MALELLHKLGGEHTLHCGGNFLNALVNNTVGANVYILTFGRVYSALIGTDVESDNDCVGRCCQHYVALCNTSDCGVDDSDLYLVV